MFLGYALFIWPVRDQYGSGVRWRVAAMGATAYLLALRLAYLYAMPIDPRLAALPGDAPGLPAGDRITVALRRLGTMLLGPERAGLNLPALLCWTAAACAVFGVAQRVFDKTTAFRALLLFSVLPVFFRTGSVFGPATVLIAAWALALWLMTFALRWEWRLGAIICGAATAIFWWPGGWLPWIPVETHLPALARALIFLPSQAVLVTPVAVIAAASYFARWRTDDRRAAAGAAATCAAVAGLGAFIAYLAGGLEITASGAAWLPLLPFIAWEMQKPGTPPPRSWGPVIYGCVVCYGLYFYSLAFSG